MKILYFITGLRLGGAEKQLLLLAEQMQIRGNEVWVAVMESGGVMVSDFESKGIKVIGLGVKGWATLPVAYKRFKKVVKEFAPDVVHAHMIHANAFASLVKLFNNQFKLVCTAHNITEGSKPAMASYYFTKRAANWATNVSKEAFDHFIEKGYFNPKRSSFVPNAIDTELFDPEKYSREVVRKQFNLADDTFVFFSAGRLHFQKNFPMLLKAFALVKKQIPSAVLYIAGEGPDLQQLEELCTALGITHSVIFLGRRNNIPELMAACDCFLLSSKFEGFGLVIAEAMAMQLPVISTDCGGVKEVMGGLGQLIDVEDINGLSRAMLAATQNRDNKRYVTSRAHIQENFGVDKVINEWTKIYNAL